MRVILGKTVLEHDSVDPLALLAVIQLCREPRRHFLVADSKSVDAWCTRWPKNIRDAVQRIATQGSLENKDRSDRTPEVRIVAEKSSWRARDRDRYSPTIHPSDAVRLLQAPLRLLVENARNDGGFIQRLALGRDRDRLMRAVEAGWIIFEHAGGLGEMKAILGKIAALDDKKPETWVRWLRLWVMFDRDAHAEDRTQPSKEATDVFEQLQQLRAHAGAWWPGAKRLERRAIENYLPRQGLESYAGRPIADTNEQRRREHVNGAFFHAQMEDPTGSDRLRASFNMPKGFSEKGDKRVDAIYLGLDQAQKDALHGGFGKDVKKLWAEEQPGLKDEWIVHARKGIMKDEIHGILTDILERI